MNGLKIALISDFHYGYPENWDMEEYLVSAVENMIEEVNDFEPDVVVVLGDFIQHSKGRQILNDWNASEICWKNRMDRSTRSSGTTTR